MIIMNVGYHRLTNENPFTGRKFYSNRELPKGSELWPIIGELGGRRTLNYSLAGRYRVDDCSRKGAYMRSSQTHNYVLDISADLLSETWVPIDIDTFERTTSYDWVKIRRCQRWGIQPLPDVVARYFEGLVHTARARM